MCGCVGGWVTQSRHTLMQFRAYTDTHACMHARTHARTHARARAHTQIHMVSAREEEAGVYSIYDVVLPLLSAERAVLLPKNAAGTPTFVCIPVCLSMLMWC